MGGQETEHVENRTPHPVAYRLEYLTAIAGRRRDRIQPAAKAGHDLVAFGVVDEDGILVPDHPHHLQAIGLIRVALQRASGEIKGKPASIERSQDIENAPVEHVHTVHPDARQVSRERLAGIGPDDRVPALRRVARNAG